MLNPVQHWLWPLRLDSRHISPGWSPSARDSVESSEILLPNPTSPDTLLKCSPSVVLLNRKLNLSILRWEKPLGKTTKESSPQTGTGLNAYAGVSRRWTCVCTSNTLLDVCINSRVALRRYGHLDGRAPGFLLLRNELLLEELNV